MNSQFLGKHRLELSVAGRNVLTPPSPEYMPESQHSRIGSWRTRMELRTATVELLILYRYPAIAISYIHFIFGQ